MELIFILFVISSAIYAVIDGNNNWDMTKRALTIGKAHKQAAIEAKNPESEQISQAQLKKLFDDALEAQRKEQKILAQNWENEFLELLPDTDPAKNAHNMRKQGINVIDSQEINFLEPNIGYTGEQLSYSERIVTKPSAYVREYPTDDTDFVATFQRGAVIRIYGWTRGRYVGKTDVWYQIKTSTFQGWVWSGSLNSQSTDGLSRLEFSREKKRIISAIEQEAMRRAKSIHSAATAVSRRREF